MRVAPHGLHNFVAATSSVFLFAAQTIDELLGGAEWRVMHFTLVLQKREWRTKFSMQTIRAVASDWQAAASFRAILRKGRFFFKCTGHHREKNGIDVRLSLLLRGEEMKDCPVMPNIVRMPW